MVDKEFAAVMYGALEVDTSLTSLRVKNCICIQTQGKFKPCKNQKAESHKHQKKSSQALHIG